MKLEDIEHIEKYIAKITLALSKMNQLPKEEFFHILGYYHGAIMEYLFQARKQLEKMEEKSSCK